MAYITAQGSMLSIEVMKGIATAITETVTEAETRRENLEGTGIEKGVLTGLDCVTLQLHLANSIIHSLPKLGSWYTKRGSYPMNWENT